LPDGLPKQIAVHEVGLFIFNIWYAKALARRSLAARGAAPLRESLGGNGHESRLLTENARRLKFGRDISCRQCPSAESGEPGVESRCRG